MLVGSTFASNAEAMLRRSYLRAAASFPSDHTSETDLPENFHHGASHFRVMACEKASK
jgi:hypothetical protein